MSDGDVVRSLNDLADVCDRITKLPIPTVAAVNEPVVGGGLEPALVHDIRVAVQDVDRIVSPECRVDTIIPSTRSTQRLPGFVGSSRAKDLTPINRQTRVYGHTIQVQAVVLVPWWCMRKHKHMPPPISRNR